MASQTSHINTRLVSKTLPIFLRTIELSDAPTHSRLLSPPKGDGSESTDPNARPIDVSTAESVITRQRESASQPTICGPDGSVISGPSRVNMVVILVNSDAQTSNGEVMIGLGGYGAIKDWERDGRKIRAGDVGVLLDPEHRGKGYAVEAMKLAIDWAFTPVSSGGPQLDLVTITTLKDNAVMLGIVNDKLGLKGRGVSRPAEFDTAKQEVYFEMKPEEWTALKMSQ